MSEIEYKISEDISTRIRVGLVHVNNRKEISLLLDSDSFSTQVYDICSYSDVVEKLHNRAGRFLSSSIKEQLHEALEPTPIN